MPTARIRDDYWRCVFSHVICTSCSRCIAEQSVSINHQLQATCREYKPRPRRRQSHSTVWQPSELFMVRAIHAVWAVERHMTSFWRHAVTTVNKRIVNLTRVTLFIIPIMSFDNLYQITLISSYKVYRHCCRYAPSTSPLIRHKKLNIRTIPLDCIQGRVYLRERERERERDR